MTFFDRLKLLSIALAATAVSVLQFGVAFAQFDPDDFSAYAEAALDSFDVPGMSVAVVEDGDLVFARGFGVRHLTDGGEVDEHTLFAIASNTKAFIVTMLAQLVDAGRLDWDDRVRGYLPGFAMYAPYVSSDMRIRDLLTHRSGLGTYSGDLLWYGTEYSAAEVVDRIRYVPQVHPFRGRYGYSNLMYITAGELLHAVTGQRWSERVRKRIFDRIGMRRTVTSTNDLIGVDNVATPHKHRDGATLPLEWYNWDAAGATGGIISSASDMAQWMKLHLARGVWDGDTLFSREASREMWSPHTVIPLTQDQLEFIPERHFQTYGLGFGLYDYQGRKIVTHGGGYDGMFSRVTMVPEEGLGIVILTNGMTSLQTALTYRLLDVFLDESDRDWASDYLERMRKRRKRDSEALARRESNRVTGTSPSKKVESYSGVYGGDMYGNARVSPVDGALVLELLPNPDLVADLTHWHYDTFKLTWRKEFAWFNDGWVQFLSDMDGEIVEMKMDVPNYDFWFHELELKRRN